MRRGGTIGWWLYGVLLAGVLYGAILFSSVPLIDLDEGRHAAIAREMLESGDFVTPRLLGKSFYDKPILYFWAQAASLAVFGAHDWAIRVPGLLFGLAGAVTTGLLGWRLFGRTAGLLAGFFQATQFVPLAFAQAAVHDVALVPWTNLALLCVWEAEFARRERPLRYGWLWTGVFLGLAILTKGLIGPAFVGVAAGLFVLLRDRPIRPGVLARLAGSLAVGLAIAAPWYVAMSLAHPGYAYYYFVERHLLGYVSDTQRHGDRAWWYYVPVLLAGGMPWVAYLAAAVQEHPLWRSLHSRLVEVCFRFAEVCRRLRQLVSQPQAVSNIPSQGERVGYGLTGAAMWFVKRSPPPRPSPARGEGEMPGACAHRNQSSASGAIGWGHPPHEVARDFVWLWLLGGFLFLSLAHSKLSTYLLPLFPAVAILAGELWARLLEGGVTFDVRRTMGVVFWLCAPAAPLALPAFALIAEMGYDAHLPLATWLVILLVSLAGCYGMLLWRQRRPGAMLAFSGAWFAASFLVGMSCLLPTIAREHSARELAGWLNARQATRVVFLEERVGSVLFYLDPQLRRRATPAELLRLNLEEFLERPLAPGTWVVVPDREAQDIAARLPLDSARSARVGRFRVYAAEDLRPNDGAAD